MEKKRNGRRDVVMTDLEALAPEDHLLRQTHRDIAVNVAYRWFSVGYRPGLRDVCEGEHERQFAYEAHTACDRHGFVLGVEVTAGNVHGSVA